MSDGKGYLLPSIINPDDSHYVCVEVPDDINHRIAFLGALSSLVKWYNWERDDLKQGAEAANLLGCCIPIGSTLPCVRSNTR